ncbi:MAG: hypothetical protein NTZ67_02020 [Gammaproteobacteria bacterium]|nr:hypothetical protein [Gammaproteobacteria bacterium]
MKTRCITFALFSVLLIQSALAADQCAVLGFKEPNKQTYDGPTWCDAVHVKNITVHGPFHTNRSTFSGETKVSGPMRADNSTFDSIAEKNKTSEVIKLYHTSHVKGNITFQGPPGKVIVSVTSSIQGKVINGKIIHH